MRLSCFVQTVGLALSALWFPASALALDLQGEAIQGGLMFGNCGAGCRVSLDDADILVAPDGRFVIGFDRDETGSRKLQVREANGDERVMTLEVAARDYAIERVDGLPPGPLVRSSCDHPCCARHPRRGRHNAL